MADVKFIDGFKTITVTFSGIVPSTNATLSRLSESLEALNATVPLASVNVTQDVDNPRKFVYRVIAKDARRWTQTLLFSGDRGLQDVTMNFSVADMWKATEFEKSRTVRDLCVSPLIMSLGMTKLVCTWS